MKGLDLRKFKKLHSNEHTTTLKHPDGHEIKIAHKGLKEGMRKSLDELPKFSNGGIVESVIKTVKSSMTEEPKPKKDVRPLDKQKAKDFSSVFNTDKYAHGGEVQGYANGGYVSVLDQPESFDGPPTQQMYDDAFNKHVLRQPPSNMEQVPPESIKSDLAGAMAAGDVGNQMQTVMNAPPEQNMPTQNINIPTKQNPVDAGQQPGNMMMDGMNQQISGVRQEAAAQSAQGKMEAAAQNEYIGREQETLNHYNEQAAGITKEIDDATHDYMNGHIDPQHFWKSKDSTGKAMTAIGLILGGIGQGLAGGENPALQFLNAQIDRDIDAQKATISQKGNIIKALHDKMGNLKDATSVAKAMYANIYAAKLQKAAAESKDPMAKARADMAIGQIRAEQAKLVMGAAQGQALSKMNSSDKVRYDNARMGAVAVNDMKNALSSGDNTVSLIGDNRFTEAKRRFVEALGRMQSGGAIGEQENKEFQAMLPTWKDKAEIQKLKFQKVQEEFNSRLQTMGVDPSTIITPESKFNKRK
jgi:hypothetical protein